ncbi:hypothetical protein QR680_013246 [Steinernema hermaphroditum]|uniref:CRIB domain-containing protein n=1 Tax=Steinernema hermaphroditum TaxID=289476 RepID=A0AA39M274_9BILA|nr:hypothetical protein QR680_013246 [Steinernema hermaphroditum]
MLKKRRPEISAPDNVQHLRHVDPVEPEYLQRQETPEVVKRRPKATKKPVISEPRDFRHIAHCDPRAPERSFELTESKSQKLGYPDDASPFTALGIDPATGIGSAASSQCPSPKPCPVCVNDAPVRFRRGPLPVDSEDVGESVPLPRKRASFNAFSTASTVATPGDAPIFDFEDVDDAVPEMLAPPPPPPPPPPSTPPASPIAPPRRNRPSRQSESPVPKTLPLEAALSSFPKGVLSPETPYEQPLKVRTLASALSESGTVRAGLSVSGRPQLRKEAHVPSGETNDAEGPTPQISESRTKIIGVPLFPVVNPGDTINQTSIENLIKERRRFKNRPPPPPPTTKPAFQPLHLEDDEEAQEKESVRSLTKTASIVSEEVQRKLASKQEGVAVYRIPSESSVVGEAAKIMSEARDLGRHQSLVIVNPGFGLDAPSRDDRSPSTPGYERLSPSAAPKESTTTVISVGTTDIDGAVQIPVNHSPLGRDSTAEGAKKEKVGPRKSVQRADAVDFESSSGYVNVVSVPSPPNSPPVVFRPAETLVDPVERLSLNCEVPVILQPPSPGWRPTPKPRRLVNTKHPLPQSLITALRYRPRDDRFVGAEKIVAMMTNLEMSAEEVRHLANAKPMQLAPDQLVPPTLMTMKADPSNSKLARVFGHNESDEDTVVRL